VARPYRPVFVGAVLGIVVFTGCSSSDPPKASRSTTTSTTTARAGADDALAIGQLAPITGPIASIAESFTAPVKLAVDEMNFSGGVNGHPVTLSVADDGSAPAAGTAALRNLVDVHHVDAVVGPSTSELALELMDAARRAPVVMCSGSNTYGPLTQAAARSGMYFRTAPSDVLQSGALASLVVGDGHHHPVVIAAPRDEYTEPLATATVSALRARGVQAGAVVTFAPDANPTAVVHRALQRKPDSVVLLGFPTASAPILRALIDAGKGPVQLPTYGSDGLQSGDLAALVDPANPAALAGMKGTTPAGSPTGIDHPFNAELFAVGVESFFSASTYDCTILLGLAAVAARSDDPGAIRDHFAANLTGTTDCATFVDCAAALKAHQTVHYRGAASRYDHWRRFEPSSGAFDVWFIGGAGRPELLPSTFQIAVDGSGP
jgi:ABC-type branched-subunit amino acid transport system substrate-binding protein